MSKIRNVAISNLVDVRDQPCADLFLDLFKAAAKELKISYQDEKCEVEFCSGICPPDTSIVYDPETNELCITIGEESTCVIMDFTPNLQVLDSTSINFSGTGQVGDPLTGSVILDPSLANGLSNTGTGLFATKASARNGLTIVSDFVELGGTLLHNTDLNLAGFNLKLLGSGILFDSFPNTRDDSATTTPINFFYTDVSGKLLSAPITAITSGLPTTDTNIFNANLTATVNRNHTNPSFDINFNGDGKFFYYNQLIPTTTLGTNNTRVGLNALNVAAANVIAAVAVGNSALANLNLGVSAIAIGFNAYGSATRVDNGIAIGSNALQSFTTNAGGEPNIAIGSLALGSALTAVGNIAIGSSVMASMTNPANNIVLGFGSGGGGVNIDNNVLIGRLILNAGGSNNENVVIGNEALASSANNLSGGVSTPNVVIGHQAGMLLPASAGNVLIGWKVMEGVNTSTATSCTAIGYNSMKGQTSFVSTAVGAQTMMGPAPSSVAIGFRALAAGGVNGHNIAIGNGVLANLTTATDNTSVGGASGSLLTTGSGNAFFGRDAGTSTTTGNNNTYLGKGAGQGSPLGSNNTVIGHLAMEANIGDGNVAIGYRVGGLATFSNTLLIANGPSTATTTGNTIIQGDFTNLNLRFPGYPQTRDDAPTPINFLYTDVNGNVLSGPLTDITATPLTFDNLGSGTFQILSEPVTGTNVTFRTISAGTGINLSLTPTNIEISTSITGAASTTIRYGIVTTASLSGLTESTIDAANPMLIISGNSQYTVHIPKVQDAAAHAGTDLSYYIAEPVLRLTVVI